MKKLKVGVVGTGVMGKEHARVYSQLSNCELVGIFDQDFLRSSETASKSNTKAFKSLDELLDNINAISVCTPTSTHFEVGKKVLDHRVSLLIEKPLSTSIQEAQSLIELAQKNRVTLTVGHIERFNPIIPVIKESISGKDIISINITRVGPIPPRIKDVGIILDLGTHDIDLIRYLSGSNIESINSVHSKKINNFEDAATLSFKLANNTIASIVTNWFTPFKVRKIEIALMDRLVHGDFIKQEVEEFVVSDRSNSYTVTHLPVPKYEPLKTELEHFVTCVIEGSEPLVSPQDALEAVKVALECIKNGNR